MSSDQRVAPIYHGISKQAILFDWWVGEPQSTGLPALDAIVNISKGGHKKRSVLLPLQLIVICIKDHKGMSLFRGFVRSISRTSWYFLKNQDWTSPQRECPQTSGIHTERMSDGYWNGLPQTAWVDIKTSTRDTKCLGCSQTVQWEKSFSEPAHQSSITLKLCQIKLIKFYNSTNLHCESEKSVLEL